MTCVIEGCGRKVDAKWCLCGEHFRMIPADLRTALARAYNHTRPLAEQSTGFSTALSKVHAWIRETFDAQDKRKGPEWDTLREWVRARDAARGTPTPASPGKAAAPDPENEETPEAAPVGQMRLL